MTPTIVKAAAAVIITLIIAAAAVDMTSALTGNCG
jgi:hypothetical protein